MTTNVVVIGVGRIGAVTAVGLAHLGHTVVGIDRRPERVAELSDGALMEREPGLRAALESARRYRHLTFAATAPPAWADVAFLCVDTPAYPSGEPDLRALFAAAAEAHPLLRRGGVLVTRSTVPVGTGDRLAGVLARSGRQDVEVVHAPEFLREGTAWEDFREPDRLVFGGASADATDFVVRMFSGLERPVFLTDRRTAELAKYAANAFLAMTISFANELSDLAAVVGADGRTVLDVLKADRRVGKNAYLGPGLGFGGHCLPKDTAALEHTAATYGRALPLVHAARMVNQGRLGAAVAWLRQALGGLDGRTICLAGLSFKAGTDDVRESPAVRLGELLAAEGATVTGFDPHVVEAGPAILLGASLAEAAAGADALVVAHSGGPWREIEPRALRGVMRGRSVFDAPGVLDFEAWHAAGFALNRTGGRVRAGVAHV